MSFYRKKNIEKIKYDKKEKKERERKMKIYGERKRKGSPVLRFKRRRRII